MICAIAALKLRDTRSFAAKTEIENIRIEREGIDYLCVCVGGGGGGGGFNGTHQTPMHSKKNASNQLLISRRILNQLLKIDA